MIKFKKKENLQLLIMRKKDRKYSALACLFSLITISLFSQDSTKAYAARYSYLHPEFNMVQFYSRSALDTFYNSWNSTGSKKISIVHLGDSHLQSDIFPGRMRKSMQAIHGDGGRGIMVAFSTAKTYGSTELRTTFTGEWLTARSISLYPKLPLGVSGMTSKTLDSNSSLTFTFLNDVPSNYSKLKIFCKKDSASFDIVVDCGGKLIPIVVDSSAADSLTYYEVDLPPFKNEITIRFKRTSKKETSFTFYGMSVETPEDKGAIYHNCGIGGAMYESILIQTLFSEQLPALNPDVVIIDFGTNDYLYDDSIKANEEEKIVKVIRKVRAAAPHASIILTSTMDMYYKGDHVQSGEAFSDIIRKVAKEENCGFFDWYWVAGGWDVLPKFQADGLNNPDGVHMSPRGYRMKGSLLSDAMVGTIDYMKKNPKMDSLIIPLDSIKLEQHAFKLRQDSDSVAVGPTVKVMHLVRKGESLSVIAKKYHVTVNQLRKWNNMQSNLIRAGKYLVVYCDPKYKPKPKPKPKPATTAKPK
ncbi:hypothetical protein BH11BAC7_BH11BAC7_30720 [soil metagenome]